MSDNNEKKTQRGSFAEFLSVKASLPSDIFTGGFRLEIRGRNNVIVHGCRRILKYSPDEMILSIKGFSVSIEGERLVCSAYLDGAVCIDGYINGVRFDNQKGDRC